MPVYYDENRKSWYTSFYYQDWQGNRKRKKKEGFVRKKDAQEYERTFQLQQSGSCEMLFSQMTELYLADCKIRQKPTSFLVKENAVKKHIIPFFGNIPVNNVTVAHVRQWQNQLLEGDKYSHNFLHTVNGYLSAIFNHAVRFYGLPKNPSKECGKIQEKRPELQFWTLDQFNQFIKTVEGIYPAHTMFMLLFWTGMRSGELLALTLKDFDFEKHTVKINKTYHRLEKQDLILAPKTEKSNRTITLPTFIEDEVKEYVSKLYDYKPTERLFNVTRHNIGYRLETGAPKIGLPKIRLHDLRHSHASLLIHLGFSPLLIQERLGHENIETTLNTYSHLYPTQQSELAAKLQDVFTK